MQYTPARRHGGFLLMPSCNNARDTHAGTRRQSVELMSPSHCLDVHTDLSECLPQSPVMSNELI